MSECVLGGGWMRRGGREARGACPVRVYVILFYVFISFLFYYYHYGLLSRISVL